MGGSSNNNPAGTAAAPAALIAALEACGAAVALLDRNGQVQDATAAFAVAVRHSDGAALRGLTLPQCLGGEAAAQLGTAGECTVVLPSAAASAARWRARVVDTAPAAPGLRLLVLRPDDDAQRLQERLASLEERLALLQELCNAGVFERDAQTLEGRWDAQIYRIFGMPVPPPGTPSPPYETMASLVGLDNREAAGSLRRSLATPGLHAVRLRVRRPDGSVRQVRSRWRVLHDALGRPARVIGVNVDDTEVVDLARRADRLREDLDVAVQLGQIAVWRRDIASGRVTFDEQGYRLTGLRPKPEGLTLEEARSAMHEADWAKVEASAAYTLRTGLPSDQTLRFRRPEGGWRHVLSRRLLQSDAEGRPVAFIGILLDESERIEHEREALEATRRLEAAAEAARIGLWSAGLGDALPQWSRRMYEHFGLDPAEPTLSLSDWLQRCVFADDRERIRQAVRDWVRRGDGPVELEFRVLRDEGVRWLLARGRVTTERPARPEDSGQAGERRRFEGVVIDINEQRQTLQRLRDAAGRVELAASTVGLGTWQSEATEPRAYWDTQMFKLRGVTSAARWVERDEVASYLHPDDRAQVVTEQLQRIREGQGWRSEFRVRWPDGTVRWLASRSSPVLDAAGHTMHRIGLNWDVTEARQAEQALRERELAVAANQAKSRFLSRVSHELRTPLNAVLGFAQLLRDPAAAGSEAMRRQWAVHIETAGRHLLKLVDDVLDLSAADAGEDTPAPKPLPLLEQVRAVLPQVAQLAAEREVRLEEPLALAGVVLADPARLRRVLVHLLSNAVKFNRRGGRVWLASQRRDDGIVLQVCDEGPGIHPARLGELFQPFSRLGVEAGTAEGTGTGLAIVKALVESMGGRVEVHSRPGEGAVFGVCLPAADSDAPQPTGATEATGTTGATGATQAAADDRRVLYIEDNVVNALLVRELLASRPGLALTCVETGAEGIARALDTRPHLILLDMQLPDMHGLQVLQALRAHPATAAIPCVALSANAMPDDVAKALQAGFDDYWTKPIDLQRFHADLERVLGRHD